MRSVILDHAVLNFAPFGAIFDREASIALDTSIPLTISR
jgi:hypothetical protein